MSTNTALVPADLVAPATRTIDAERLIAGWKEGRSPETLRSYTDDLENFATWRGVSSAGAAIDELLRAHPGEANELAGAYKSQMIDGGLAPATINRRLSAIRSIVSLARDWGFIGWELSVKNVMSQAYRDTRGPTAEEVARLLELAGAHQDRAKAARDVAMIMLMFGQGLRRKEVSSLDVVHFDSRASRLQILGKGRREPEWITLSQPTLKALRAWVARRGREPGPLFFGFHSVGGKEKRRNIAGGRLTGGSMHRLMAQWGEELGFNLRPHGLRHSFVTTGLDQTNGNLRAVRIAARQRSVDVIVRYDDNREDLGGKVASQVAARVASIVEKFAKDGDSGT